MNNIKLKNDLFSLPCFKITDEGPTYIFGQCRNFQVRVLQEPTGYKIQFGVKKNFDRWSNSCNFEFFVDYKGNYTQHFKKTYTWMMKVVKSDIFDFDSYFATIDCAWFYRNN